MLSIVKKDITMKYEIKINKEMRHAMNASSNKFSNIGPQAKSQGHYTAKSKILLAL
jgi:hypothetical protein